VFNPIQVTDEQLASFEIAALPGGSTRAAFRATAIAAGHPPRTWVMKSNPAATASSVLKAIWGSGRDDVYAGGGSDATPIIIHSSDRGQTWNDVTGTGAVESLAGRAADAVYACAKGGVWRTTDAGAHWSTLQTNGYCNALLVSPFSSDVYYSRGAGDIEHTADYGITWTTERPSAGTAQLAAGLATPTGELWAVGGAGMILHSHVGDGSWTTLPAPTSADLNAVWENPATGSLFIAGAYGLVMVSHDGGASFSQLSVPSFNGGFYGLWGAADDDVYVAGDSGGLFHFDGSEWKPESVNTTDSFKAMWGSSATDVYVVGNSGTLLHLE
jgi:photosystem II stability/assembly factor-like uncharacterized protein